MTTDERTIAEIGRDGDALAQRRAALTADLATAREQEARDRDAVLEGEPGALQRLTASKGACDALERALSDLDGLQAQHRDALAQAWKREQIAAQVDQVRQLVPLAQAERDRFNVTWTETTTAIDRGVATMIEALDRHVEHRATYEAILEASADPDAIRDALTDAGIDPNLFRDQNAYRPEGTYAQVPMQLVNAVLRRRADAAWNAREKAWQDRRQAMQGGR